MALRVIQGNIARAIKILHESKTSAIFLQREQYFLVSLENKTSNIIIIIFITLI